LPDTLIYVFGPETSPLGIWRIDEVDVSVERDLPQLYSAKFLATKVAG
jgi:hypothetical protein